ncbi:nitrate reductase gamma subunit [Propionibacterium cyclohexanicum]|uniref:Nitrate reductase-like protein NarX n=1 Tax=Propionibacterium cyclohexanicum TaxID=64702 RepID=A0A1H9U1J8_9ACTN|nr:respiratory nitrate reductase subunit gamma [Propionibacterium cyclohexanicum]SES03345.1 nitrate reductase gamma subunit [Propionibacterium cyclohexanicum]
MSVPDVLLWVVLPYLSIVLLVGGMIWRYRTDQFGWTSRSSEWQEKALLRWSSPMFHFGILFVAAGHAVGLAIPQEWTGAVGISEQLYHLGATVLGAGAALITLIGLCGLLYRRIVVKSVRLATSRMDIVTYIGLTVVICLGTTATVMNQIFGPAGGYNYRDTISVWFRSIPLFNPQPQLMIDVPIAYKLHIIAAMLLFCVWPFTRLVHVVSAPVEYVTRPYVVYRSRDEGIASAPKPRGW